MIMPRLPELNPINAAPAVREIMAEQERHFGFVLNPIKQMELTDIFGDGGIRRRLDCSDLAVRCRH